MNSKQRRFFAEMVIRGAVAESFSLLSPNHPKNDRQFLRTEYNPVFDSKETIPSFPVKNNRHLSQNVL